VGIAQPWMGTPPSRTAARQMPRRCAVSMMCSGFVSTARPTHRAGHRWRRARARGTRTSPRARGRDARRGQPSSLANACVHDPMETGAAHALVNRAGTRTPSRCRDPRSGCRRGRRCVSLSNSNHHGSPPLSSLSPYPSTVTRASRARTHRNSNIRLAAAARCLTGSIERRRDLRRIATTKVQSRQTRTSCCASCW